MIFDWLKTMPQYVLPKQGLTFLAGCLANVQAPAFKNWLITQFIKTYQVNMAEALVEDPHAYACFNDFFIRQLKPQCRPIASSAIISPVDGVVSEMGAICEGQLLQAKGRYYSVQQLLASSAERAKEFHQGQFMTLYLSPKDYHRVHLPMDAQLHSMTYVPGALFSVQPTTARVIPHLFARNERLVINFTTSAGPMAMVMVGATIVGAIGTSWEGELKRSNEPANFLYEPPQMMQKAQEAGYFKLGSTVILLFAEGQKITWEPSLQAGSPVCFGQNLGEVL